MLLEMSVEVHGEALPVTPGNRRIIVNIPAMTAVPSRLRFPGGAAGLSGPIAPGVSRTKSGPCSWQGGLRTGRAVWDEVLQCPSEVLSL